jgi:hypothetical protein
VLKHRRHSLPPPGHERLPAYLMSGPIPPRAEPGYVRRVVGGPGGRMVLEVPDDLPPAAVRQIAEDLQRRESRVKALGEMMQRADDVRSSCLANLRRRGLL